MTADPSGRLRLTVLGCSSAVPHSASPAAGFLLDWGSTAVLLDVGQGVVRRLESLMDPRDLTAVVVGHMHADHFLDLAGLRYVYPWGERAAVPLPVHLPPGGARRMDALAEAISERPGFFDVAYDIDEYDPDAPLAIGPLPSPSAAAGTTSRPGPWPSRRPTGRGSSTPATPGRATRSSTSRVAPICCSSRRGSGRRRTTIPNAAT